MSYLPYIQDFPNNAIGTLRMLHRLGAFPLDPSTVFNTRTELEEYVNVDGSHAYAGQVVAVANGTISPKNGAKDYTLYIIRSDMSLQRLANSLFFNDENSAQMYVNENEMGPGEILTIKNDTSFDLYVVNNENNIEKITIDWKDLSNVPFVTPEMFGAIADWEWADGAENIDGKFPDRTDGNYRYNPDMSTDNTEAFQKAIDSGKTVYVPTGNYKLSNTIYITKPHTHLIIDGNVATSAYIGIVIKTSDVRISGNGAFWFYGRRNKTDIVDDDGNIIEPMDTRICGTAICINGFNVKPDGEGNTMRIVLDLRLKRPPQHGIYDDYEYYTDGYPEDRLNWGDDDHDCIAVRVISSNTDTNNDSGAYPITVNSTISCFKTGIAIRHRDFTYNGVTNGWSTGFEFNGSIENCDVAMDIERAGGSHFRGSVQPKFPNKNLDNRKKYIHTYKPLVTISSSNYFDTMLWDMHEMINSYGLVVNGDHNHIARYIAPKYIKCGIYRLGNTFSGFNPYPTIQLTSPYQINGFYQYKNILENAMYSNDITITESLNGMHHVGGTSMNNMFTSAPRTVSMYKTIDTQDVSATFSISFSEAIPLRGLAVTGEILPSKIIFKFYSKTGEINDDGTPVMLSREIEQVCCTKTKKSDTSYKIENDGDYCWNNGGSSSAYWQWTWENVSMDDGFWGKSWTDATIDRVDITFISSSDITIPEGSTNIVVAKIEQIFAMTSETTYITRNGGNVNGELNVPTPKKSTQVVNKEYVDSLVKSLQDEINSLKSLIK